MHSNTTQMSLQHNTSFKDVTDELNTIQPFLCDLHFVSVKKQTLDLTLTCNTIPNTTKACEDGLVFLLVNVKEMLQYQWLEQFFATQFRNTVPSFCTSCKHFLQQGCQNSLSQRHKRSNCSVTIVSGVLNHPCCLSSSTKWKRKHQKSFSKRGQTVNACTNLQETALSRLVLHI